MYVYISFAISAALILLGFVALLTQRVYLDSETGQPTEVQVPIAGVLKSNYPALVFVFFGFALALYTYQTSKERPKVEWVLRGSLKHPENKKIDWPRGSLTLVPQDLKLSISEQGHFEITMKIEEGRTPEDFYEMLDFTLPEGSVQLQLKSQYQAYTSGKESLITYATPHMRIYAPLEIELYPET